MASMPFINPDLSPIKPIPNKRSGSGNKVVTAALLLSQAASQGLDESKQIDIVNKFVDQLGHDISNHPSLEKELTTSTPDTTLVDLTAQSSQAEYESSRSRATSVDNTSTIKSSGEATSSSEVSDPDKMDMGELATQEPEKSAKEQWTVVAPKRKRRPNHTLSNSESSPSAERTNRVKKLTKRRATISNKSSPPKKPLRPPPIAIAAFRDFNLVRTAIATSIKFYHVKAIGSELHVFTETTSDFEKVQTILKEKSIKFHTFALPENKTHSFVIRGLPREIPESDIMLDLNAQGATVNKVQWLRHPRFHHPLPLLRVDTPRTSSGRRILDIQTICQIAITVEHYKDNSILQCHRCQMVGHSKNYCHRQPACVKCGGSHLSVDCKKSTDTPAQCANCGGSHAASYYPCLKNLLSNKKAKTINRDPQRNLDVPNLPPDRNIPTSNKFENLQEEEADVVPLTPGQATFSQIVQGFQATKVQRDLDGNKTTKAKSSVKQPPKKKIRVTQPTQAEDVEVILEQPQLPQALEDNGWLKTLVIKLKEQFSFAKLKLWLATGKTGYQIFMKNGFEALIEYSLSTILPLIGEGLMSLLPENGE